MQKNITKREKKWRKFKMKEEFKVGERVIVNGEEGGIFFKNAK